MNFSVIKKSAAVIAIFVLLFIFGVRVDHPKSGLRSALGSASTSIAIYRDTTNVKVGDKVLANLETLEKSPTLAFVRSIDGKNFDIQSDAQMERIQADAIRGHLIAIVPFIGTILGAVGLQFLEEEFDGFHVEEAFGFGVILEFEFP